MTFYEAVMTWIILSQLYFIHRTGLVRLRVKS